MSAGAKVNAARLHETPLHHAAKNMRVEMIEILVEFGANVYARDQHNRKPVDYTTPGSPSAGCLSFYESEYLCSACFTLCYIVVSACSQRVAAQWKQKAACHLLRYTLAGSRGWLVPTPAAFSRGTHSYGLFKVQDAAVNITYIVSLLFCLQVFP